MAKISSQALGKVLLISLCGIAVPSSKAVAEDSPAIKILLSRAQTQAQGGHLDIAASTWKQVLIADPTNMEALRNLASAETQLGNQGEADAYIQRLRKLGASPSVLGQLQSLHARPSDADLLKQAASLSRSGQYAGAMEIYRKLYGNNPPAGETALIYYDTEAALPAERGRATEGLRKLAQQFPADERYSITLGRVLTYDAATRQEGLAILQRYPSDPGAQQALKQGVQWNERAQIAPQISVNPTPSPAPHAPIATTSELGAGFRALNSGNLSAADQHFHAALAHEATHGQANAGLGFVNMRQQNFSEAVKQFEQAREEGDREATVTQALATSRFWEVMGDARTAMDTNDTEAAVTGYRSALALKPDNPDALTALGGTLLRAGRPKDAVPYLQRAVRVDPKSQIAWRALFLSQSQASQQADAVKTAEQIPADVRTKLASDLDFLGELATDYAAIGQQSQSDRILSRALSLLQTDDGSDLPVAKQLQYASLMMTAKRYNTAVHSYRRILAAAPDNADAWRGLVAADHLAGRDTEALREFRQMPAAISADAQTDPAFLSMLAGIYQSQSRMEAARATLARAIKIRPSVSLSLQLASLEMSGGDKGYATELYEQLAGEHPESKQAWIGWMQGLHATGHDREALRQVNEMPEDTSDALRDDPEYLQTIASIYGATGNRARAADAIEQVNEIYAQQGIDPPPSIQIQQGWLLLQAGANARLARVIQSLSNDEDLTDDQRAQLSRLWSSWTLQRASQLTQQGKPEAAVVVLSAALRAFPSDVAINNALADAYVRSGDPKRAVALYARQDMAVAESPICASAIRAALAAGNRKQAQSWLQTSLDRFGHNPQILELSAEFEQQRGDSRKAAAYYQAALAASGPPSIGELTSSHSSSAIGGASEASATQTLFQLLSSSNSASAQNVPSRAADLDRDNQAALWPVRPSADRSDDSISRGRKTQSAYDDPLPLPAEDTPRRRSRDASLPDPLSGDSAYRNDPPLPALDQPTTASAKTLQPRTRHAAADTQYDSQIASPPDDSYTRPQRIEKQYLQPEQPLPATTPTPSTREAATAQLSFSEGDAPVESARGASSADILSRLEPNRSQPIQTINDSSSLAALVPLPSEKLEQLPPLTGATVVVKQPLTPRQQMQENLDAINASSSPFFGGSSWVGFHNGQPGFDRLTIFAADIEQSSMIGNGARATIVVHPTLLQGGITSAGSTFQLGTLPLGAIANAQSSAGVGGELQLRTRTFGAAVGYTPHGFLVENVTGRLLVQPDAGPVTLSFERQPIDDSQLSFAGLRDPGSVSSSYAGNIWGGVISNAASVQVNRGDAASGWYAEVGGQYITGQHVETNYRIDGYGGAYWSIWENPTYGKLTLGMNFFGMHFANNQRLFTYGNGGYFSPGAYLLSNIPVSFNGHYGTRFHYRIAGALGLQAFQEGASPYFPIDSALQAAANNPFSIGQTSVGANYNVESEGSYLMTEHWHVGGFFSSDNSRGYNNDRLGFYLRYALHPQSLDSPVGPTGLDRGRGLRPLAIP
jgi:tetratricopeptide (TPR) repeat protein